MNSGSGSVSAARVSRSQLSQSMDQAKIRISVALKAILRLWIPSATSDPHGSMFDRVRGRRRLEQWIMRHAFVLKLKVERGAFDGV